MKHSIAAILARFLSLALLGTIAFACQSGSQNEVQRIWDFEVMKIEKKVKVGKDSAVVSISYPEFAELGLQKLLEQRIVQSMSFGEQPDTLSLDLSVQDFLDKFLDLKKEFPDSNSWEFSLDARVSFQGDSLLSLVLESFSYTGGAHPNSFRSYLNYEKDAKSEIPNADLVLDEKALLTKAELEFRNYHDVEDGVSLKDDGRFFLNEGDMFFLPAAMGYEPGHLVLYYGSYEIGAYAMGPTELKIPLSDLIGVVAYAVKKH